MTSSIFLPRRSRAWPEPRTHLTESTMFVLPEPFGPTMAVTPPSNWISVCRANVLKPSNCRDFKNKTGGESTRCGAWCCSQVPNGTVCPERSDESSPLVDRFAELTAARRLDCGCMQRDDLGLDRLGGGDRGLGRRLARLAWTPGARLLGLLGGGGHLGHRAEELFQGGPGGV